MCRCRIVVAENVRTPAGQIWAGNPAKFLSDLKGDETVFIPKSAESCSELGAAHSEANAKSFHALTFVQDVEIKEMNFTEQGLELSSNVKPSLSELNSARYHQRFLQRRAIWLKGEKYLASLASPSSLE